MSNLSKLPPVISLAGFQGAGKSTTATAIADMLAEAGYTCETIAFAAEMRNLGVAFLQRFGVRYANARALMSPTAAKNIAIPELGGMTQRDFLRSLGEWGRDIRPDFWVELWKASVDTSGADVVLVDDVRYPNEIEAVKAFGGHTVWLDSEGVSDGHTTEQDIRGLCRFSVYRGLKSPAQVATEIVDKLTAP